MASASKKLLVSWLFGRTLTAKDLLRKNQRALNRAMWDIDRERIRMENQEKKIIFDLKKVAKENQMESVRILAKDLVRTRRFIQRFMLLRANLQAVSMKIRTVQSQHAISEAMLGVTIALRSMNRQFRMPQIQRILQEFEKQSVIMGSKEEAMTDTIEETACESEEDMESDTIVTQILDELGLQLKDQLSELPEAKGHIRSTAKIPVPSKNTNDHSIDADLQARLDNLRRE
jgi:charged multivesicular body protein 2A